MTTRSVRSPQQDRVVARPPDPPPVAPTVQPVGPAHRGVRTGAALLDVAAMMSPALPLSIVGALLGVSAVIYIVVPVAFVAVWAWLQTWQGLTGRTFGKAMMGLRLVCAGSDQPPGLGATLLRSGLFISTLGLVALPVVSDAAPRRGAHDRISGLEVVDVADVVPQPVLRKPSGPGMRQIHSPVPMPLPRRG